MAQKFKNYVNEKKLVDLHQAIKDGTIEKFWGKGLSYDGKDIFDTYIKSYEDISIKIKENFENAGNIESFDGQEVYLGYDKKNDEFISGWDCWVTEEEENPNFDMDDEDSYEDEYELLDSSANATVRFKISKGKIKIVDTISWVGNIFYDAKAEGYSIIKKNGNIVDIRLD